MSNTTTKCWSISRASVSERNGGLLVEGTNTETGGPIYWHVKESIVDARYDFSGCDWQPGALTVAARILDRASK